LLTRCNFDFVKIDRQLVAELAPDKPPAPWLDGLAALLQTTSLQIIAEGVETAFQPIHSGRQECNWRRVTIFHVRYRQVTSSVTLRRGSGPCIGAGL